MADYKKNFTAGNSFTEGINCDAGFVMPVDIFDKHIRKPRLLLHSCCGPCSTSVIERLVEAFDITVFFYNPNITDESEYNLRKKTQIDFLEAFNRNLMLENKVEFMEGEYNPQEFFSAAKGLEHEKEGGMRCERCFELRLEATARLAAAEGFDVFGTTLTVSPYKNYGVITMIGSSLAMEYKIQYLDLDFKKKAGYQRSIELSKEYGLYRQHYCGCDFSKINK